MTEQKKPGRKPKPPGERSVRVMFSLPPDLKADIEAHIPDGERSRVVQDCLRREVARRKRARDGE